MKRARRADLAVFAAALALRLLYLRESAAAPTAAWPIIDAATYHDIAADLAQGRGLPADLFWQPVLYPLLLAGVYAVAGVSVAAAQALQALLGALTCVLTRRLGERLFGPGVGLAAGLATALYGPLIFHESELLAAGLAAFWVPALLLLLTDERRARPGWAFLWGLCGGLSVLTRTEFLPFFVAASCATLVADRPPVRTRTAAGGRALLLAAGFAAVAVPASLLDLRLSGHRSFLPASGGLNLYLGNNPDPCASLAIRPGWAWDRLVHEPVRAGARDDREGQRYFLGKALAFAREEPGSFLRGLAGKAAQLASSREIPRNLDVYLYRRWSSLLRLLVWKAGGFGFPFGVLFPLAVAGAVLQRRRVGWPLALFLLLYPAALVAVFVSARYRAPLVPALAVLAAAGVAAIAAALRGRRLRTLGLAAAVLTASVLVSVVPGPFCAERLDLEPELHHLVGTRKYHGGQQAASVADFRAALALDPRYAEAHGYLGAALVGQGARDEGLAHLRRAVELDPASGHAHNNLGAALAQEGRADEAEQGFRRAVAADPLLGEAAVNLANLLAARGRSAEAIAELRRALSLQPGYLPARRRLEALERGGR